MSNGTVRRGLHLTNPLLRGPDVKALQDQLNKRALDYADVLHFHLSEDGDFGPATTRAAHRAANAEGLAHARLEEIKSGHIHERVQEKLRDPSKRTDAEKKRAPARRAAMKKRQAQQGGLRKKIIEFALWGDAHEPSIHYRQSRPIDGHGSKQKLPLYTDCSGFVTDCYEWAGAPDPNGFGFNGYGYTGTILQHCQHITKGEARAGDLVVYGSYPGTHVVVLIEDGSKADPLCVSHGQEAGPIKVPQSVEARAHAGQSISYLRVPGLD